MNNLHFVGVHGICFTHFNRDNCAHHNHSILDYSFGYNAARHKARNVKFAVISCFIIVNWKHVVGGQLC